MKMHLMNIMNQFDVNDNEKTALIEHFKTNIVTYSTVAEAIIMLRVKSE